jgi:hypothetical protein
VNSSQTAEHPRPWPSAQLRGDAAYHTSSIGGVSYASFFVHVDDVNEAVEKVESLGAKHKVAMSNRKHKVAARPSYGLSHTFL